MDYGIAHLSIIPGRSEPSDKSEQSNQLLFGEPYSILEEKKDWVKVRTLHDDYECWIDRKQSNPIEGDAPGPFHTGRSCEISIHGTSLDDDSPFHLVLGSLLSQTVFPGMPSLSYPEDLRTGPMEPTSSNFIQSACSLLNTPYQWGGRTPFGIDCSGFVQLVFLLHGLRISRDASQQVEEGESIPSLEESAPADLVFFQNEKGKVTHVGFLMEDRKLIHASGKVRIDPISEKGIHHSETHTLTHSFHSIRRFIK